MLPIIHKRGSDSHQTSVSSVSDVSQFISSHGDSHTVAYGLAGILPCMLPLAWLLARLWNIDFEPLGGERRGEKRGEKRGEEERGSCYAYEKFSY